MKVGRDVEAHDPSYLTRASRIVKEIFIPSSKFDKGKGVDTSSTPNSMRSKDIREDEDYIEDEGFEYDNDLD
ncbi:hypothetical protein V6N13_104563 [Hibiscus sabdariffa]